MDFREVAGRMAVIALRHPDTVGSRQMFATLGVLVGQPTLDDAKAAVTTLVNEVTRLRANGIPQVRLPHEAAQLFDEAAAAVGSPRTERTRPAIVDGTWAHEGIAPGGELSLGLGVVDDQWREDRDGSGIRLARCQVVRLGADAAGVTPYIWFRDVARPHEGIGALPLERFRKCMELGEPGAAPGMRP